LGQGDASLENFKKQLVFAAAGLLIALVLSGIDYNVYKNYSTYIFIGAIIMLLGVLVFGQTVRGTKGWFNIAGMGVQPVEIVKVVLIIVIARLFSAPNFTTKPFKYLVLAALSVAFLAGLVLMQPDFGSSVILFMLWFAMILAAGFDKKYFIAIILTGILAGSVSWLFFFEDYQKQRILTFVNPSFDPLDQGYNIAQAIIAVGSGRFFGRGIGFGSQSQLKFLPESQNDFIFAVIAEELGFLGVCLVIFFFSLFFYRCVSHIRRIKDEFGVYVIIGAVSLIFIQMFINIGMNIGILPVVGISLPFVSYGGSALVSSLILIGIVESVIRGAAVKTNLH
jgi:rod shape determining protein RodA